MWSGTMPYRELSAHKGLGFFCLVENGGLSLLERYSGSKKRHVWAQGEERLRASLGAVEAGVGAVSGRV